MFQKRRELFKEEMGWSLKTDEFGRERDEYDDLNPLYIIVADAFGGHLASTRIMPTTSRTMIGEHFSDLTGGSPVAAPDTWEITRLFVSAETDRRHIAALLMWAGCAFARSRDVISYVGVIGTEMAPVFTAAGARPEVIGRGESPEGAICACRWATDEIQLAKLAARVMRNGRALPPVVASERAMSWPAAHDDWAGLTRLAGAGRLSDTCAFPLDQRAA